MGYDYAKFQKKFPAVPTLLLGHVALLFDLAQRRHFQQIPKQLFLGLDFLRLRIFPAFSTLPSRIS